MLQLQSFDKKEESFLHRYLPSVEFEDLPLFPYQDLPRLDLMNVPSRYSSNAISQLLFRVHHDRAVPGHGLAYGLA